MRMLKITFVAALLLVGAACSDDGGGDGPEVSEKGKPYVEALSTSFKDGQDAEELYTDDQIDCISASWVAILKPERLEENGVTPDQLAEGDNTESTSKLGLSTDEGYAMVDAFDDCDIDIRATFLRGIREDDSTTDEQADCIGDAIDEGVLRDYLAQGLTEGSEVAVEDSEVATQYSDAITKCQPRS